ncbi:oxidoreductase,short chain dehydrogenase-like protein [Leptodontidium sp. 2 PMI_412]|nr:oxidoreductase,short chain dehydrogenase-like protein [Leptodontidium sp. 2 PMI_412]
MSPSVWLVTGCSSGFGSAFVHEILSRGDKVIATGRNASTKLAHLGDTGAAILDLDVTAPQEEIDEKIKQAIAVYGQIDVLVNNAGYVQLGFVEGTPRETYISQLNTNFFGAISVTTALLPHFRARRTGRIAFLNSIFAWSTVVAGAPYAVSKQALNAFALSLHEEVRGFGIKVVSFEVGHFRTPVLSKSQMKVEVGAVAGMEDYKPLVRGWMERSGGMSGNQPGDPKLGISRMVDVLRGEGFARGKPFPLRLPIGSDAVEIVKKTCEDTLKNLEEWRELSVSTDFDEPKRGPWAVAREKGKM